MNEEKAVVFCKHDHLLETYHPTGATCLYCGGEVVFSRDWQEFHCPGCGKFWLPGGETFGVPRGARRMIPY